MARFASQYAWALWLAAPLLVTILGCLVVWARARPRRAPTVRRAIKAHAAYLDALGRATSTGSLSAARAPSVVVPAAALSPADDSDAAGNVTDDGVTDDSVTDDSGPDDVDALGDTDTDTDGRKSAGPHPADAPVHSGAPTGGS